MKINEVKTIRRSPQNNNKYFSNHVHDLQAAIYRAAENKIPHQTIWNIFATSGQILKMLEAV